MPGLRLLAWLEGISFLLILFVTMPLKYMYAMHSPNLVIGMIHGVLFLAYCVFVLLVMAEKKWSLSKTGLALLAAFLPFGTFVADARIFRK